MKRVLGLLLVLALAALVVLGFWYLRSPKATAVRPGEPAPDFTLPSLEGGRPGRLSETRGAASVLVLFDTRWPSSRGYVPHLERVYRRYFRRGLRMVGVVLDTDAASAREFLKQSAVTFTVLHDPGGRVTSGAYGVPPLPESYLIDPAGNVVAAFSEPVDWLQPERRARLEAFLRPLPPGGW